MTGQIHDEFIYEKVHYEIVGISTGSLLNPFYLGLNPIPASTACWRGYQLILALAREHLLVKHLLVRLQPPEGVEFRAPHGPVLNGIEPQQPPGEDGMFINYYEDFNLPLTYSGGLLIADGFIQDLYVHMGFQSPWKYERVLELIFQDGLLQSASDRSEAMAELRWEMRYSSNRDDEPWTSKNPTVIDFIQRAFDLRYD